MPDLKTIKQLVKLMVDNELTELDVEGEGERIKLKRGGDGPHVHYVPSASVPAPGASAGTSPAPVSTDAAPAEVKPADKADTINSPMVGTFYTAPSPDAEPFVNVGDRVTPDTVVCIIEAMKVFNEIKAEKAGVIREMLVDNGQAVEFDQPLFEISPE